MQCLFWAMYDALVARVQSAVALQHASVLLCQVDVRDRVIAIASYCGTCGAYMQVKLVLQRNRLFVESPEKNILEKLLEDIDIKAAHEACGNAGIKSGQGRLDTAAAAIATTMQTIDLTKVPQEDHDDDGDGDQPGTSGGKQRGGDVEDEEAEEAERSFRAGGATNTGAKKTLACASARAAGAGAQTNAGKGNSNSAAAQGAHPGGRGSKEGGEQCAPQPVPHSKQSAVPEEAANVELFSFEISPLHVRSRCFCFRCILCFVRFFEVQIIQTAYLDGYLLHSVTCLCRNVSIDRSIDSKIVKPDSAYNFLGLHGNKTEVMLVHRRRK